MTQSVELAAADAVANTVRQPAECPHRSDVRQDSPDGETVFCQLLGRWIDTQDATQYRVPLNTCQACCRNQPPSQDQLNPVLASLLYHLASQTEAKAAKLRQWAYENLKFIPAPRDPEGPGVCEQHRTGGLTGATACIRFVRHERCTVGRDFHRSGWPYARQSLQPLACQRGVLLDDYVEQTFCYQPEPTIYQEPWIGIFHHPPNIPEFATPPEPLQEMLAGHAFQQGLQYLRGAITLSEYLAEPLRQSLSVPVWVVRHPSEIPEHSWSMDRYHASQPKKLVQLGWYLRNTRAIYQVPKLTDHCKLRYLPDLERLIEYDRRVLNMWYETEQRVEYGGVTECGYVPAEDYDEILNTSVVLTELFDASANNVIVECIARGTPIIVNRHPATIEYLGAQYPLYFNEPSEIPELLQPDRVLAAHQHMMSLDRTWLNGESFCGQVAKAVLTLPISAA